MTETFDSNAWYTIRFNDSDNNALQTSSLYSPDGQYGAAYLSPYRTNTAVRTYNWQLFPSPQNSSQYIIRRADHDPMMNLAGLSQYAFGDPSCPHGCSATVGITSVAGDNAVWNIIPSGDGLTSYLSNIANGSSWQLAVDAEGDGKDSWLGMAQTKSQGTGRMRWLFSSVAPINNITYSTAASGFTTPSTSSAFSSIGSALSPTIPTPAGSSSTPFLSTATATPAPSKNMNSIIGGAVGGFAVLTLSILSVLLLLMRRKKARAADNEVAGPYDDTMKIIGRRNIKDPTENGFVEGPQTAIFEAPRTEIVEAPKTPKTGCAQSPHIGRSDTMTHELPAR